MYTSKNFKTKKALKEAVQNGEQITVFQPNNIFNVEPPKNGKVAIEMPWYPEPHRSYAVVTLENGIIIKVQ